LNIPEDDVKTKKCDEPKVESEDLDECDTNAKITEGKDDTLHAEACESTGDKVDNVVKVNPFCVDRAKLKKAMFDVFGYVPTHRQLDINTTMVQTYLDSIKGET